MPTRTRQVPQCSEIEIFIWKLYGKNRTYFVDQCCWQVKNIGVPVEIGGDNLASLVGIGLTDLPNIGEASGPHGPPGSGITVPTYINRV